MTADPSPPAAPARIGIDPGQPRTRRDEFLEREAAARGRPAPVHPVVDEELLDPVGGWAGPGWELRITRDGLSLVLLVLGLTTLVVACAVAFGALPAVAAAGAAATLLGYLLST